MHARALVSRPALAAFLALSLALNLAVVTSDRVFAGLSGIVGRLAGAEATVAGRQAAAARDAAALRTATVRRISDRVSARSARTAARRSASALAEAVPVLGSGAIAASLALDIADACANAEDMHALELALAPGTDPDFSCRDRIGDVLDDTTAQSLLRQFRDTPQAVCASARDYADAAALSDLPGWVAEAIRGVAKLCPKR